MQCFPYTFTTCINLNVGSPSKNINACFCCHSLQPFDWQYQDKGLWYITFPKNQTVCTQVTCNLWSEMHKAWHLKITFYRNVGIARFSSVSPAMSFLSITKLETFCYKVKFSLFQVLIQKSVYTSSLELFHSYTQVGGAVNLPFTEVCPTLPQKEGNV